jgi:hypothetical protein
MGSRAQAWAHVLRHGLRLRGSRAQAWAQAHGLTCSGMGSGSRAHGLTGSRAHGLTGSRAQAQAWAQGLRLRGSGAHVLRLRHGLRLTGSGAQGTAHGLTCSIAGN